MDVVYTHGAGLDVHKKTVVACCITRGPKGEKRMETRTFGTMTADLLAMSDWLTSLQITHVAMESTGEFWKPIYNLLEGNFELLVANAKHIKAVPGRKTDVKDAEWIAELLRHGLLRGSFIPPQAQRDLRDLTRQRTNLVQDRATVINRLQKVLEWANIKLSSVATDVTGVSARRMLEALVANQVEPSALAELAKGRLRNKRTALEQALNGVVRDHHRFLIAQHLMQIDFLDEQISLFDEQIAQAMQDMPQPPNDQEPAQPSQPQPAAPPPNDSTQPLTWEAAIDLADTVPGVGRRAAEMILAEIGIDMSHFPTEAHLASWAKLSPGNNQSAGKHYSGATGHGNRWLRTILVQVSWAAVKVKKSYLSSFYYRLAARRGAKRAIIAVAHRILIAIYQMLKKREPYKDLGATYLDQRNKSKVISRLQRRIEQLGYRVTVEPLLTVTPT
ncbi:IS110 family transposase [Candidatus Amarolinea aalborgensis]|jgi:transposase|uniref:IS110 family transposase n=1 Tax=Candidatus Amarolinea aalborgensis TaxID=2249329 RepID=UPI003BF968AE